MSVIEADLKDKNQKIFKAKSFIQKNYIILELESETEKYSNRFTFEQLIDHDKYFKQSDNLEDSLQLLGYLFEEECSVNEMEGSIDFLINYKKRNISFKLYKIDENIDISYDSLNVQIQRIIDKNQLVLGIDLGTTYSSAAVMIDKNIIMIRNSLGFTTTPSYVSFISKNEVYVGELAKLLPSNEKKNIIFNTKRLLGKKFDDDDIKEMRKKLPFKLKKDERFNSLKIGINNCDESNNDEDFYPEQICALILEKIVKDSEFYLSNRIGKDISIKDVVLTVPAYFNQKQREATLNSAKIVGLNIKTMINEPTSASLAYAYQTLENADKNIIVIDFGGGTLDITLLRYIKNDEAIYCDVKYTYGNTNFGGEDFDNMLMENIYEQCVNISDNETISPEQNIRIKKNNHNLLRLKRACERAKIKLSSFESTNIHIEKPNYESIYFPIYRKDFIEYCKSKFDEFGTILDNFIEQSKINIENIAEVILTGGTTLIPKIKEIIKGKFHKSKIRDDLNPKEVVAMGASIRGAKFSNLPSVEDIKLFDVTNLPLGVKLKDNIFNILIPRNTPIPYSVTDVFETVQDKQNYAIIEVYEGEKEQECDKNNLFLGKFKISGLPEMNKGEAKINVKLEVKENLILEVTATDNSNVNNKQNLIIEKLNGFPTIIEELKEKQKSIHFFDNKDYNEIKFSIMENEDEIRKLKNKKTVDVKMIKSYYNDIIEKIGEILIKCNITSNLYISFVKYYFNKICEFFKFNNINKTEDLEKIKGKTDIIFEKIKFYNRDIIYEIIEETIDEDIIYKNLIDLIMQSLYDEINTIYSLTKSTVKDNKKNNFDEASTDLSNAKSLIDVCKNLIDKYDKDKKMLNNITKNDLVNFELKIVVREEIIKWKKRNFFKKILNFDKKKLKELYNKYSKCNSLDIEDLKELSTIIEINMPRDQVNPNFVDEFEKAQKFIEWLTEKDKTDDIIMTIHDILQKYPYAKTEAETKKMWDDFYKYKVNIPKDYLLKLKGKYQKETMVDIEQEVFLKIKEYINLILEG